MFLKRIMGGAALVMVVLSSGCYGWREYWCERHCGCRPSCPPSAYYAPPQPVQPTCCVPCCCPAPAAPGPAPSSSWARPAPAPGCCQ
jgi:hypothetical protein